MSNLLYTSYELADIFSAVLLFPISVGIGKMPRNDHTLDIVPLGRVGSTFMLGKLNPLVALQVFITFTTKCQLVGHMLGDGAMRYLPTTKYPMFRFVQSAAKFPYIWSVYNLLSHYCNAFLKLDTYMTKDTVCYSIALVTRHLACFAPIFHMFYTKVGTKWVKTISVDILPYITPTTLAYWIMDDGSWADYGTKLHTQGFTHDEVLLLVQMLHHNLGLVCSIQKCSKTNRKYKDRGYMILIRAQSTRLLRTLVTPHMHPSMMYKIGIGTLQDSYNT
jgi:hypothetical protein